MSVTEADAMTLMGETQEAIVGGRQEQIAADIQRQYAYEQGKRAEFGTTTGVQLLDTAIPLVTGSALGLLSSITFGGGGYTGVANAPGSFQTRLPQEEIFVPNAPPPVGSIEPGSAVYEELYRIGREGLGRPTGTTMPVPVEPPTPVGVGLSVGVILGGIIGGMLIPDFWTLDREAGPYDTTAGGRNPIPGQGIPQPRAQGPDPDVFGPPSPEQGPDPGREAIPIPGPAPYDFGDTHERARKAMEDQLIKDMTTPQPQPPPAPAPAPQSGLPPWAWTAIGLGSALILGRRRGSRSSQTLPLAPILDLTTINEPLLSSLGTGAAGMPLPLAGGSGWGEASSDSCNCTRKSGRKRKCLARAPLTWRGGPKKGKAAGSKCYRFAT